MGGVFRDADERWFCGFSMVVSKESIFQIETRAIHEGLSIAWEKVFRQETLQVFKLKIDKQSKKSRNLHDVRTS